MRGSMPPPTGPTRPSGREKVRFGEHCREAGRAGTLGHGLLRREMGVDRPFEMALVDAHDGIDMTAHDRQRLLSGYLDGDAFGHRGPTGHGVDTLQCHPHGGIHACFDADQANAGLRCLGRGHHSGDHAAADDGDGDRIEVRPLLQHFERQLALAGDHVGVVIGVDEDEVIARADTFT